MPNQTSDFRLYTHSWSRPPAFANAVRNVVPASFELPAPGPQQFLVLVPVILAAAVLTSPQAPDVEELADVL